MAAKDEPTGIMPQGLWLPNDPDEAERELSRMLAELHQEYQMRAKPLMEMLLQYRNRRINTPTIFAVGDSNDTWRIP